LLRVNHLGAFIQLKVAVQASTSSWSAPPLSFIVRTLSLCCPRKSFSKHDCERPIESERNFPPERGGIVSRSRPCLSPTDMTSLPRKKRRHEEERKPCFFLLSLAVRNGPHGRRVVKWDLVSCGWVHQYDATNRVYIVFCRLANRTPASIRVESRTRLRVRSSKVRTNNTITRSSTVPYASYAFLLLQSQVDRSFLRY
jgi:hypothetical protein